MSENAKIVLMFVFATGVVLALCFLSALIEVYIL